MKKIIFLSLGVAVLTILAQINTPACVCATPLGNPAVEQRVKNKLSQSEVVFSGEVIKIRPNADGYGFTTTFKVKRSWKGAPAAEIILLGDGSDCEYQFTVGEKYLVFAAHWKNVLTTGDCSGNSKIEKAAKELKALGNGEKPKKSKRSS